MQDRDEISVFHSAVSNLLVGILSGSIISSIFYFEKIFRPYILGKKGFLTVDFISTFEVSLIFYLIMLMAYLSLFELHHPKNIYTTEIMPKIFKKSGSCIKYLIYVLIAGYLIGFAFLSIYLGDIVLFFGIFAVASFLDLCWSGLLKYKILKHKICSGKKKKNLEKFDSKLNQWFSGDIAFFVMSLFFFKTLPYFQQAIGMFMNAVFITVFLVIVLIYYLLTALTKPN